MLRALKPSLRLIVRLGCVVFVSRCFSKSLVLDTCTSHTGTHQLPCGRGLFSKRVVQHIDEVDAEEVISCRLNGPAVICHWLINSGSKKQQSWSLLTLRLERRKRLASYNYSLLTKRYCYIHGIHILDT